MSRTLHDWEGMLAQGRETPGIPFLPAQMQGAPRRLVGVIRQRRVRVLRQPDGRLVPEPENYNPDFDTCDIWLRWVPSPTVRSAPTVGRSGEPTN